MKNIELNNENTQNLEVFTKLLKKDKNTIINEALERYFVEEHEKLQQEQSAQTNLSYEEFWDGIDL